MAAGDRLYWVFTVNREGRRPGPSRFDSGPYLYELDAVERAREIRGVVFGADVIYRADPS
jgi:hypothetical protein